MEKLLILFLKLYSVFYLMFHTYLLFFERADLCDLRDPNAAKDVFLWTLFFTGAYLWFFNP